ncbi:MAG TPA: hypothetical protein VNI57_12405, partial [Candidatus Saccharimonadales bacterium]|nr:hypothetical protein [Candidatus Saccharimonadales bacterium]
EAPVRTEPRRLTSNPAENWVTDGDISPDGSLLAFADQIGIHVQEVETGSTVDLPLPDGTSVYSLSWFPDGSRILTSETSGGGETALWSIPIRGGERSKLKINARQASVSPDGKRIAFLGGPTTWSTREIWVMGSDGSDPRTILAAEGIELFSQPIWSPTSQRVAFVRYRVAEAGLEASLESMDASGNAPAVRAAHWRMAIEDSPPVGEAATVWMPDGRIVMARGSDLFAVKVDEATGQPDGEPRLLASWNGFELHELSVSSDGRRLTFQNRQLQSDIYIGKLGDGGRRLLPPERATLDDRRDSAPAWSADSREIFFQSDRRGNLDILRQGIQGRQPRSVAAGPGIEMVPGVSPDGASVLFWHVPAASDTSPPEPWRLMRAPIGGGPPVTVLETAPASDRPRFACAKAPSETCLLSERKGGLLVFSVFSPGKGRGPQMATVPVSGGDPPVASWALSPDGERVALLSPSGRLRVIGLDGSLLKETTLTGAGGFERVAWSAGGDGLFVIGRDPGAILLYTDLKRPPVTLWETTRTRFLEAAASPDGTRLAVAVERLDSDIWMVEGL